MGKKEEWFPPFNDYALFDLLKNLFIYRIE